MPKPHPAPYAADKSNVYYNPTSSQVTKLRPIFQHYCGFGDAGNYQYMVGGGASSTTTRACESIHPPMVVKSVFVKTT